MVQGSPPGAWLVRPRKKGKRAARRVSCEATNPERKKHAKGATGPAPGQTKADGARGGQAGEANEETETRR